MNRAAVAPNILLLFSDQQRWDTLGVLNPQIRTPNLDRLARGGMLFERAYAPKPVCLPCRASLLTGQYSATHGAAAQVGLKCDRSVIAADGKDLSFVTVSILDKDGLMVPRSKNHLKFEISGPGEIVATDNGDATDHTSFQSRERNTFNGLALVIVRSKAGQSGRITLKAAADGLRSGEVVISSR